MEDGPHVRREKGPLLKPKRFNASPTTYSEKTRTRGDRVVEISKKSNKDKDNGQDCLLNTLMSKR